jgi:hypothetical protein
MVKAKFDFAAISHRRFWSLWSTVVPNRLWAPTDITSQTHKGGDSNRDS